MRTLFLSLLCLFGALTVLQAQDPGIAYQAVARDADGDPLADAELNVRVTLYSADDATLWQESHASVLTNQFGNLALTIGDGAVSPGFSALSAVDWSAAGLHFGIEVDAGAGYASFGDVDVQAVPIAMYALNGQEEEIAALQSQLDLLDGDVSTLAGDLGDAVAEQASDYAFLLGLIEDNDGDIAVLQSNVSQNTADLGDLLSVINVDPNGITVEDLTITGDLDLTGVFSAATGIFNYLSSNNADFEDMIAEAAQVSELTFVSGRALGETSELDIDGVLNVDGNSTMGGNLDVDGIITSEGSQLANLAYSDAGDAAVQANLNAEVTRATDAENALDGRLTAAESDIDGAEGDIDSLEGRMDSAESDIDGAEGDIDSLEGRMDTAESDIDGAEGDIDSLEGRMDTAESDIDGAEGDIDSLEGRMDTAESDIDGAEGDIDSLEGRMDTAESDIDGAEGDIDSLEGRMDTAESDIDGAEGDIDSLEGRMDTAESDIDGAEGDIDSLEGRMDSAESDVDDNEFRIAAAAADMGFGESTVGTVNNVPQHPGYANANYLGADDNLVEADEALDAELKANADADAQQASAASAALALNAVADSTETAQRIAADGVLQSNIVAEAGFRAAADSTEAAQRILDVNAEEDRALLAEGVLQSNIESEAAARAAADSTETAQRILDVNAEEDRALLAEGVLQSNIESEAAARAAADSTETAQRILDVDAEEDRAMLAESGLQDQIDDERRRHFWIAIRFGGRDHTTWLG